MHDSKNGRRDGVHHRDGDRRTRVDHRMLGHRVHEHATDRRTRGGRCSVMSERTNPDHREDCRHTHSCDENGDQFHGAKGSPSLLPSRGAPLRAWRARRLQVPEL